MPRNSIDVPETLRELVRLRLRLEEIAAAALSDDRVRNRTLLRVSFERASGWINTACAVIADAHVEEEPTHAA